MPRAEGAGLWTEGAVGEREDRGTCGVRQQRAASTEEIGVCPAEDHTSGTPEQHHTCLPYRGEIAFATLGRILRLLDAGPLRLLGLLSLALLPLVMLPSPLKTAHIGPCRY